MYIQSLQAPYNLRFLSGVSSPSVRRLATVPVPGFFLTTTPFNNDFISFFPDFGGARFGAGAVVVGFRSDGEAAGIDGSAAATSAAYFFARALCMLDENTVLHVLSVLHHFGVVLILHPSLLIALLLHFLGQKVVFIGVQASVLVSQLHLVIPFFLLEQLFRQVPKNRCE